MNKLSEEEKQELNELVELVKAGIFNDQVQEKALRVPDNIWNNYEFVNILGGGNPELSESVLELARQKMEKELKGEI